ncbi:MAG: hypothetical protein WBP84_02545 [Nitrososphaeraceae archaeon]
MLRIRDNEATIRQLKFPENTLEKLRTNDLEPEIVVNASLVEQIEIRFAKGEFVPDRVPPDRVRQILEDLRSRGLLKISLMSQSGYGEFPSRGSLMRQYQITITIRQI